MPGQRERGGKKEEKWSQDTMGGWEGGTWKKLCNDEEQWFHGMNF